MKWRKRGKKNKRPGRKKEPTSGKQPRQQVSPDELQKRRIHWHLSSVDTGGDWSVLNIDNDYLLRQFIPKLKSFETMQWGELDRNSHPMPVNKLCREAQNRLVEIGQDDAGQLYSLRFGGSERLWGIRDRAALRVLWWDPNHTVYPTPKK